MPIPISAGMQTSLEKQSQRFSTMLYVLLKDGTELAFTDCDRPIVYPPLPDPEALEYIAAPASFTRQDVTTTADISVGNSNIVGMMTLPNPTQADIRAGVWDFAYARVFAVNRDNLADGVMPIIAGWFGEIEQGRDFFNAEIRDIMQAYSRTIGELTSAQCRNNLGDARCMVDLAPFTFSGTLTGVGADNQTMYDSGRAQAGPSGPVSIVSITQADPGVVTTASALGLPPYSPVQIAGCIGMTALNTTTSIRNPSGVTFELPVDTTGFPAYGGGGTVTPLGGTSGYFDNGIMTMVSCAVPALNGLSMEVRSYVPGQWVLMEPWPYQATVGDTYSIIAGCDKTMTTCIAKFDNAINNRSEWYLPGPDKVLQVGKQQAAVS